MSVLQVNMIYKRHVTVLTKLIFEQKPVINFLQVLVMSIRAITRRVLKGHILWATVLISKQQFCIILVCPT